MLSQQRKKGFDTMPNIMLTYRCNLHCSYCFANEFVNKENRDINVSSFMKAVSFLTAAGKTAVGLIGGEPTLHPAFQLFMEMLINNPKVSKIVLYTNGLLMNEYIPQIAHPKVGILVNCNSPAVIGEKAFSNMRQNLDTLIMKYYKRDGIHLGMNLFSDSLDYSYILELLQRYKLNSLRISVTVPDFSSGSKFDSLKYFAERKEYLMRFFRDMDSIQAVPYYDCNIPPYCIWTDEEKEWLEAYVSRYPKLNTNLVGHQSLCLPVIDILPNLQAVRCFGMSDYLKVPIEEFRCYPDLYKYFYNEIDSCAFKQSSCEECKGCYERKTRQCAQGCLGFRAAGIRACNEAFERL